MLFATKAQQLHLVVNQYVVYKSMVSYGPKEWLGALVRTENWNFRHLKRGPPFYFYARA